MNAFDHMLGCLEGVKSNDNGYDPRCLDTISSRSIGWPASTPPVPGRTPRKNTARRGSSTVVQHGHSGSNGDQNL